MDGRRPFFRFRYEIPGYILLIYPFHCPFCPFLKMTKRPLPISFRFPYDLQKTLTGLERGNTKSAPHLIGTALGVANELFEFLLQSTTHLVFSPTVTDTWLDLLSNTIGIGVAVSIFSAFIKTPRKH